jgi:hypothetical protein
MNQQQAVSLRIFAQRHLTAQIPNAINQKFKSSWRFQKMSFIKRILIVQRCKFVNLIQ